MEYPRSLDVFPILKRRVISKNVDYNRRDKILSINTSSPVFVWSRKELKSPESHQLLLTTQEPFQMERVVLLRFKDFLYQTNTGEGLLVVRKFRRV